MAIPMQDPDDGGIADRPDDAADIFHTFFGIAGNLSHILRLSLAVYSGLSLLGYPNLNPVDPVFALPIDVTKRLNIYTGDGVDW